MDKRQKLFLWIDENPLRSATPPQAHPVLGDDIGAAYNVRLPHGGRPGSRIGNSLHKDAEHRRQAALPILAIAMAIARIGALPDGDFDLFTASTNSPFGTLRWLCGISNF